MRTVTKFIVDKPVMMLIYSNMRNTAYISLSNINAYVILRLYKNVHGIIMFYTYPWCDNNIRPI